MTELPDIVSIPSLDPMGLRPLEQADVSEPICPDLIQVLKFLKLKIKIFSLGHATVVR